MKYLFKNPTINIEILSIKFSRSLNLTPNGPMKNNFQRTILLKWVRFSKIPKTGGFL